MKPDRIRLHAGPAVVAAFADAERVGVPLHALIDAELERGRLAAADALVRLGLQAGSMGC